MYNFDLNHNYKILNLDTETYNIKSTKMVKESNKNLIQNLLEYVTINLHNNHTKYKIEKKY